jgi:hypothetical protein
MSKTKTKDTAAELLTEEQLKTVSGGVTAVDRGGNLPTCPAPRPILHTGSLSGPEGPIK